MIVRYYPIYKKEGLNPTSVMIQYAKDHLLNDPITQFIDEHTIEYVIKRPYLHVYPEYFKWHQDKYLDAQVASPDVFI